MPSAETMRPRRRLAPPDAPRRPRPGALAVAALLGALLGAPAAAQEPPKVVLFEDPALGAERLFYPLLISEGRGYPIRCDRAAGSAAGGAPGGDVVDGQAEEDAVIRGLGFASVPSRIVDAADPAVAAARPEENPRLCPQAADYPIKVFAARRPEGLTHYLQFPTGFGAAGYGDRLYTPGCAGVVEALKIDVSAAVEADPTPFFAGKIHRLACLTGAPFDPAPTTFAAWCAKTDRSEAETATVRAALDATPGGVSAIGQPAACAAADQFLRAISALDLSGEDVASLAPLAPLAHLTSLSLADNAIEDVSPLERFTRLTLLDLSGNRIAGVAALAPLTALTRLDLSRNRVSDIRPLAALPLLATLALDGNAVSDLRPLQLLPALRDLSLAANGLTGAMLEPLTALGALTRLDLSDNAIETFEHLGAFPSTLSIDLSGNPIAEAGGRSFLDLCILHRDAATPFGQTVRALLAAHPSGACAEADAAIAASTTLDLSGRILSDLRPLAGFTHLTALDLSDNAITDLSPLAGLTRLIELDLAENQIVDIRPIAPLVNLTRLDATGNPTAAPDFLAGCLLRRQEGALTPEQILEVDALLAIAAQPSCEAARARLRSLDAAEARGRSLTTLAYFPALENVAALDLGQNALTRLDALAPLQRLTHLDAGDNRIESLAAVSALGRLERLRLDGNPLTRLDGIAALPRLTFLNVSRTEVTSLRPLLDLPLLEQARLRDLALTPDSFAEYCLAHRLDPLSLGADLGVMAALEPVIAAAGVDGRDCRAAEAWARGARTLTLNKKSIVSVAPLRFFEALEELYLFDNLISDVWPIAQLRGLKKLNLSANRLGAAPTLQSTGLVSLWLARNDIRDIGPLARLSRLTSVSLAGNAISDATPLRDLADLDFIDLRDNRVGDDFNALTAGLQLLMRSFLKGNPVCVPPNIFLANTEINRACTRDPLFEHFRDIVVDRDVVLGGGVLNREGAVRVRCPPLCLDPTIIVGPGPIDVIGR